MANEARSRHAEEARKVSLQYMRDAQLIMPMRFLKEAQVPIEAIFAFPLFNLRLHGRYVRGEGETFAIIEPYIVIWFALQKFHAFGLQAGVQVGERLPEKVGEEEERGTLVESLVDGSVG